MSAVTLLPVAHCFAAAKDAVAKAFAAAAVPNAYTKLDQFPPARSVTVDTADPTKPFGALGKHAGGPGPEPVSSTEPDGKSLTVSRTAAGDAEPEGVGFGVEDGTVVGTTAEGVAVGLSVEPPPQAATAASAIDTASPAMTRRCNARTLSCRG